MRSFDAESLTLNRWDKAVELCDLCLTWCNPEFKGGNIC